MVNRARHKDPYRAFFTMEEALGDYMVKLLKLSIQDTVFEPAAGDGHLIDAIQKVKSSIPITAYELHPDQIANLNRKFSGATNVKVVNQDTIFCPDLDLKENFGPKFSKIIANPPYGGWQEYERRADLKKRFKGFYVRETYTLFLLRCLRLLEHNGKLVFIIPNTFLYLNMHAPLRKYILENFAVETIDVFKSSLFPGISFGYADLCIISISARQAEIHHSVRLRFVESLDEFESPSHLEASSSFILQKDILRGHNSAIPMPSSEHNSFNTLFDHETLMSDVSDCVTGFYSGADKQFLRRISADVKRSNGYEIVDPEQVEYSPNSITDILNGISSEKHFIPILKGGGFHFLKPTMWFIDWSKQAVGHYKTDKKARFQNSSFYFRRGIGFPMVTSTKPTASLIEQSLFDQSIVGIFPKGIELEFLLAYCNSKPFWACLKTLNPSANNSAKYVRQTPIIRPDPDEEALIAEQTKELLFLLRNNDSSSDLLQNEILDKITSYVKQKASNKALEPTSLRAAAQL